MAFERALELLDLTIEDDKNNYIKLDNDEGIYVTYKLAETNNYKKIKR